MRIRKKLGAQSLDDRMGCLRLSLYGVRIIFVGILQIRCYKGLN